MAYVGSPELSLGAQEQMAYGLQHRVAEFLGMDPTYTPAPEAFKQAFADAAEGKWGVIGNVADAMPIRGNEESPNDGGSGTNAAELQEEADGMSDGPLVSQTDFDTRADMRTALIASGEPFLVSGSPARDGGEGGNVDGGEGGSTYSYAVWYPVSDYAGRLPIYWRTTTTESGDQTRPVATVHECILLPNLALPPMPPAAR